MGEVVVATATAVVALRLILSMSLEPALSWLGEQEQEHEWPQGWEEQGTPEERMLHCMDAPSMLWPGHVAAVEVVTGFII
jgi:hypothetical protein